MKKFSLWNWLNNGMVLKRVIADPSRNNFDFIRLGAALVVIVHHCIDVRGYYYLKYIGALGVPAFFFLSGLLASDSLYRSNSWRNFLWRRAIRIYPAAIFVILFSALIIGPLATTLSLRDYFLSYDFYKYISSVFLINVQFNLPGVFENSVLHSSSVNVSLWTLPLEIKLYVLILVWSFISLPHKKILLFLLALSLIVIGKCFDSEVEAFAQMHFGNSFSLFPYITAVPAFILGCVCHDYKDNLIIRNYWIFIVIILFFIAVEWNFLKYIVHFLIVMIVLHVGSFGNSWLKKITPQQDISYGMYLYAYPVEQLIINYIDLKGNRVALLGFTIAVSVVFAIFSWNIIEKRALRQRHLVK